MSWLDTLEEIRTRDFKKATMKERDKIARDVVNTCSYAAAVVAVVPIPFSDAILMLPIQSGMVMTIGHVYGRPVDGAAAKDLLLELGTVAGVGFLARQGIKALLPVLGAFLTVPAAFAANWGIGRVAMEYFKNPGASKDYLREVYEEAKREGGSLFSRDRFSDFREKNEDSIKGVAEQDGDDEEAPAAKKRAAVKKKPVAKKKPAMSVKQIVEKEIPARLAKKSEVVNAINAVIHLDIAGPTGGQWTMDLTKPKSWVSKGLTGAPKMTVSCEDQDFIQIATGKKDAQMAVLMGSLKFEPMDMELAASIGKVFG
jgi:uncharacterized protein (DUF697 family)/putative sterol carrier protein